MSSARWSGLSFTPQLGRGGTFHAIPLISAASARKIRLAPSSSKMPQRANPMHVYARPLLDRLAGKCVRCQQVRGLTLLSKAAYPSGVEGCMNRWLCTESRRPNWNGVGCTVSSRLGMYLAKGMSETEFVSVKVGNACGMSAMGILRRHCFS